ncbi:Uncharacterized protein conserved in bacteria [Acidipropionibacterium jensenii]|uniref:Uncharacterized protein conserved in bacteria n=1 Tax=Acidipropionibacterium jensenii TaxID=1749 RepID=A0A3S4VJJ7_9ACTN|nr:DUF305 domain-containing protein [Acidipropionibacterium jensenii]MDN6657628.1 DUF305 domain-containing protein [Acidipropionibacterium jensenii]VEI03430.1 Uncharacterized protein conserved in bacteria [Acidipropionibacterium jensenii]
MSPKSRVAIGSGVAVVAVIGLVSCLAATNPSTATSSPSASAPASAAVSPKHNAQDMSFTTMMIVHHQGAIDMSALVPERASSDAVKTLAVQIQEAQGPEIQQMKGWLTVWKAAMAGSSAMPSASSTGSPMGGMSMPASSMPGMSMPASSMPGMDHSSHQMEGMTSPGSAASSPSTMSGMDMPGMTPADMAQLKAARGTAFDRLFLQKMIVHHQAAVEMSKTELTHGTNPQAISLAADIISSQTAQITQMQNMLDGMK